MAERVAVVSGVSKGLGASLAEVLVERGFDVVGIGRSATLQSPRFRLVQADLRDVAGLPAIVDGLFVALAGKRPASIALINNAAIAGPAGTIGDVTGDDVAESLNVNLVAPTLIADAFVREFARLPGDRRLINVSSGAAAHPIAGAGIYCMAKAGLEMLTQVVAAERASEGIVAITIRPGIIDTPMQAEIRSQPRERLPSLDMFRGFHESGQLVPPRVTATKLVERLVMANVDNGRVYSYAEL